MIADLRHRFVVSLALTVPVLLLSHMVQDWLGLHGRLAFPGDRYVEFALSAVIFFYGGWPFLSGLARELRGRLPGMMTLIGLAISVAFFYSAAVTFGLPGMPFYWELATLIDIMLLGHWIEMKSVLGASNALGELARLIPANAHRLNQSGSAQDVPVSQLVPGDLVLVKPGERVPTDGVVREGRTSIDESMLTGESRPVAKDAGARVTGGSVNGEGAFTLEVQQTGAETYLARVMRMVEEAQQSRSQAQDLANRAALWLTFIALGAGAATLAGWLFAGQSFSFALERMVTVMVITCPHALGLAIPLVIAGVTALGAQHGLLLRDRTAFENARQLSAIVIDKTGTLTEGRFGIAQVIPLASSAQDEVLRLAAGVEQSSEHSIARGVLRGAGARGLAVPAATGFSSIPGQGAVATVEGAQIAVVSPGYVAEAGLDEAFSDQRIQAEQAAGRTVVFVLRDGAPLGAISLDDVVREDSAAAIERLKKMGLRPIMLTGDAEPVARRVAAELGIEEFFAGVLPEAKAAKVAELQQRGLKVAMVGDGVNDAPALATADLGIAIGAGTDVAAETADVILVRSSLPDAVSVIELSAAMHRKMVQNLAWATGYNLLSLPLAAGVFYSQGISISPAFGAVLMSLSTVVVAINARLLKLPGNH